MAPIPPPSIHLPPQDPFRNAYLGSWQGEGKINIDPKINCESVKMIIEPMPDHSERMKIKNMEVSCSGMEDIKFEEKILTVEGESTFEGKTKVGDAVQPFFSGSRKFSYNVEIPLLGQNNKYEVTLQAYPNGLHPSNPTPLIFFDILVHSNAWPIFCILIIRKRGNG